MNRKNGKTCDRDCPSKAPKLIPQPDYDKIKGEGGTKIDKASDIYHFLIINIIENNFMQN